MSSVRVGPVIPKCVVVYVISHVMPMFEEHQVKTLERSM